MTRPELISEIMRQVREATFKACGEHDEVMYRHLEWKLTFFTNDVLRQIYTERGVDLGILLAQQRFKKSFPALNIP
jgi:hypothetical protein